MVEVIQNDQEQAEEFYQKMLAAGIARKEPYNVVSPGDIRSFAPVWPLVVISRAVAMAPHGGT